MSAYQMPKSALALPRVLACAVLSAVFAVAAQAQDASKQAEDLMRQRSEEHTSELQSPI